jgi:hypothetical protein
MKTVEETAEELRLSVHRKQRHSIPAALMSWLDTLQRRGLQAMQPAKDIAPAPIAKPAAEIKSVWFQRRAPASSSDLGEIDLGYYSVADGVLTMHDESGKPTGKEHRLAPGDDPRALASRFAWRAWQSGLGIGDFNRPLGYGPSGYA